MFGTTLDTGRFSSRGAPRGSQPLRDRHGGLEGTRSPREGNGLSLFLLFFTLDTCILLDLHRMPRPSSTAGKHIFLSSPALPKGSLVVRGLREHAPLLPA